MDQEYLGPYSTEVVEKNATWAGTCRTASRCVMQSDWLSLESYLVLYAADHQWTLPIVINQVTVKAWD